MIWGGTTVYTIWGYVPITTPALQWIQGSNGYWSASDRGAAQDIYEASLVIKGPEAEVSALEAMLQLNRETFSITCGVGEEIFGADVLYTGSLSVSVVDYGRLERTTMSQYALPLRLRLLAPAFKSVTASLAALRLASWRYGASSSFEIGKAFSYNGTAAYADHASDTGRFLGDFTQTQSEMEAIRSYLLTTGRGNSFAFPYFGGVDYPFGFRKGLWSTLNCKILSWSDMGRDNLIDWKMRLELVEAA